MGVWVIEQCAIILSATVRSPTVISGSCNIGRNTSLTQNLAKTRLSTQVVAQLSTRFGQNTVVSLPCSVQTFRTIWPLKCIICRTRFRECEVKMGFTRDMLYCNNSLTACAMTLYNQNSSLFLRVYHNDSVYIYIYTSIDICHKSILPAVSEEYKEADHTNPPGTPFTNME